MTRGSTFTCFGGANEQSSTPRARPSLFAKKMMFFRGLCNGSNGGVGGGLMTCVVDCQHRWQWDVTMMKAHARARSSLIAKKEDVPRWIMQEKDLWGKVPELVQKTDKQNAWNPPAKTKKRKLLSPRVVNDPVTFTGVCAVSIYKPQNGDQGLALAKKIYFGPVWFIQPVWIQCNVKNTQFNTWNRLRSNYMMGKILKRKYFDESTGKNKEEKQFANSKIKPASNNKANINHFMFCFGGLHKCFAEVKRGTWRSLPSSDSTAFWLLTSICNFVPCFNDRVFWMNWEGFFGTFHISGRNIAK